MQHVQEEDSRASHSVRALRQQALMACDVWLLYSLFYTEYDCILSRCQLQVPLAKSVGCRLMSMRVES